MLVIVCHKNKYAENKRIPWMVLLKMSTIAVSFIDHFPITWSAKTIKKVTEAATTNSVRYTEAFPLSLSLACSLSPWNGRSE